MRMRVVVVVLIAGHLRPTLWTLSVCLLLWDARKMPFQDPIASSGAQKEKGIRKKKNILNCLGVYANGEERMEA
jgi:hypothetical protein